MPLTIILALAATVGLALLAFRKTPEPRPPDPGAREDVHQDARPKAKGPPVLRRYQTTATLAEDLRDALAGEEAKLAKECWRVSKALAPKARWTLLNLAREEASPKVRALIVLAAGVHAQDEGLLLDSLDDAWPVVRLATVLACGYVEKGKKRSALIGGLEVPLGRKPAPETEQLLRKRYATEKDEAVKKGIGEVLAAGGLSRPR